MSGGTSFASAAINPLSASLLEMLCKFNIGKAVPEEKGLTVNIDVK